MYINLSTYELSILKSAMEYASEQYAASNGAIDPCCLADVRDAGCIGQYVDGKRIMNDVLRKITATQSASTESTATHLVVSDANGDEDLDIEVTDAQSFDTLMRWLQNHCNDGWHFYTSMATEQYDEEELLTFEGRNDTTGEIISWTGPSDEVERIENIVSILAAGNEQISATVYHHINTVPSLDAFLDKCTTHGGNWTAMFLSGIKAIDPSLFERMPDLTYEFDEACWIANHLIEERQGCNRKYEVSCESGRIWMWDCDTPVWRPLTAEEQTMPFKKLFCKLNNMSEAEYEAYNK